MKDLLTTIWGGKHCGWCTAKDDTWWEKLMRQDQRLSNDEKHWWEKAADKWSDICHDMKIWRLGEMWHWKFHPTLRDKINRINDDTSSDI